MYFDGNIVLPQPYSPLHRTPTSPNVTLATYTLDLDLNEVVEVVMVSYSSQQHPWHIHGHDVWLMGAGSIADDAVDNSSVIFAALDAFTYHGQHGKRGQAVPGVQTGDSWTVPAFGYQVFRLQASNPGPWLLHCHVAAHMTTGMALVLNVGVAQGYAGLEPPPSNARCGFTGPPHATGASPSSDPEHVAHPPASASGREVIVVCTTLGAVCLLAAASWYVLTQWRQRRRLGKTQAYELLWQTTSL